MRVHRCLPPSDVAVDYYFYSATAAAALVAHFDHLDAGADAEVFGLQLVDATRDMKAHHVRHSRFQLRRGLSLRLCRRPRYRSQMH